MARLPEVPITPEQFRDASKNYLNCLRLAPNARVLIVTDSLPGTDFQIHILKPEQKWLNY